MPKLTAAVIGLGQIGQGYDYALSKKSHVLTHAAAFSQHPAFQLIGGVDPNPSARRQFTKKFSQPAYPTIAILQKQCRSDVIALAVPTPLHYQCFMESLVARPRAILCEKPLAATSKEGKEMVRTAHQRRCVLLVNYIRRFEPGANRVRKLVRARELGHIDKGVVWYSKGILNAGSHLIDLLHYWLGPVTSVRVINKGRRYSSDLEPDLQLKFGSTIMYFMAGREEKYTYNTIELHGESGVIWYTERGSEIAIRKAGSDKIFPSYRVLKPRAKRIPTDLMRYQWHVVDHLARHLRLATPLPSTGKTALQTLRVVEQIQRKVL